MLYSLHTDVYAYPQDVMNRLLGPLSKASIAPSELLQAIHELKPTSKEDQKTLLVCMYHRVNLHSRDSYYLQRSNIGCNRQ